MKTHPRRVPFSLLRSARPVRRWLGLALFMVAAAASAAPWTRLSPAEAGLDPDGLASFAAFVGGRGVVVRHGAIVHSWGDISRRGDVASACKPVFAHFLFKALTEGRIPSLDQPVVRWEPGLSELNPDRGFKDAAITWRHLATQTSCYGLVERPGEAYAYNDWQIALFADLLFNRVFGAPWEEVDARLLHPLFVEKLGCEDAPTLLAFGPENRPGRLAISPRDFARFGLLYLREGRWEGEQVVSADAIRKVIGTPLPADLPRAGTNAAPMLPGQRTLGSGRIPDNQTHHYGSYSFLWWVNGIHPDGTRHWPDAPLGTYAALGHGGRRALVVIPALDIVVSWNDSPIDSVSRQNEALQRITAAAEPRMVPPPETRRRVIIETDAGGDPDDEQSLVRFLLHANEWDIEGIIANRPEVRRGENRNSERTGLGVVRRLLDAYAECWPNLVRHDPRYPHPDALRRRTVTGYNTTDDAIDLLQTAVNRPDPRPIWYSDWGTDHGAATNNLRRLLDRVLHNEGQERYATVKERFRLSSSDAFGPHTAGTPAFAFWVDTWSPPMDGRRWYHRFSALTARAGGFDIVRDCLTGHGPLGALYPTNTTHWQKEGDSLSFIYLVPTGLDVAERPEWGGWGGRHGHNPAFPGRAYFFASRLDSFNGTTNRDNTLLRWAPDIQNEFKARLDWCVQTPREANHPPLARINGGEQVILTSGAKHVISASMSCDPDGDDLSFQWILYPEAGTYSGRIQLEPDGDSVTFVAPEVTHPESVHLILRVTDDGDPPLSRYRRVVFTILPGDTVAPADDPRWAGLESFFAPPVDFVPAERRSVLRFDDGRALMAPGDWPERRREILRYWQEVMGPWPDVIEQPKLERLRTERRETFSQQRVRLEIAPGQTGEGWLLIPDGEGPFPAVLVVYYEPETSVGLNPRQTLRDFALQLTRRGFVTLSIGTPGGDARRPEIGDARCQPLSFHAYVAANAWHALARLPHVDSTRIGVTGHSYGGKWAMFAAALWDRFAAVAVSDPGIVFDETRPNVNYWEPWYLGLDDTVMRRPGLPTDDNPRTGAYARLIRDGRDLDEIHALIAPRPFLVSGGSEDPVERWNALSQSVELNRLLGRSRRVALTLRPAHAPTPESNEQLCTFFELALGAGR